MEVSYNILDCLPETICEDIFSYLPDSDLLQSSLVAASWYDFIARSSVCMKKIKLVFNHMNNQITSRLTPEMEEILMTSARRYENVDLMFHEAVIEPVTKILKAPGRKWKRLRIFRANFPSTACCMNFLSIFDKTAEEIRLDKVYIDSIYYFGDKLELTFPKLRILETKYVQSLLFYQAFANCTGLKEFHITSGQQTSASINALYKMFHANTGLKKLSIITQTFTQFFNEDHSKEIDFKLTSLEARDLYNLSDVHKTNFKLFMVKQLTSLEKLNLGDWMGLEIVHLCFHMPRLTDFVFKGFHNYEEPVEWKNVEFHRSTSLTTLHLIETNGQVDIVRAFLRATPNVKHLRVYTIKNDTLDLVSSLLPNLESLETDLFEAIDISGRNLFPNLKKFSAKAFQKRFTANDIKPCETFGQLVLEEVARVWPDNEQPKMRYSRYGRFGNFR